MKADPTPIAIIGFSGRFPGADSPGEFWANLMAGKSAITEVPADRWDGAAAFDPDLEAPNKSNSKWGAFLHGIDLFDPLFFGVSPREAACMDPQQRIFLEESWNAFEHAGYAPAELAGTQVGVFAGVAQGDYLDLVEKAAGYADGYLLTGNTVSTFPGRVSYLLDLKGPCLAVDTACSSALVAIHLGCESLRTGRATMVLAGGVAVMTTPKAFFMAGKTGLLSPTGCCRAFDDAADGYVPGEAAAMVVLKPLDRALADGDHIHAVIRGSAINHDGRTNGLTAPNAHAQSALQREVLAQAGVTADSISLVEAMATGTHLGDAIEVNGLSETFRRDTARKRFCPIGSLKTNLGHSGHPSGAAGLLKLVLALQHGQIPPSLNHDRDNGLAHLEDSPFFVADRALDWPRVPGQPRRALLNAFGHSGTNACLLVEEPPLADPGERSPRGVSLQLVVLSGKTEEALRGRVRSLLEWAKSATTFDLGDVAFTLALGRAHFRHRVVLVASGRPELLAQLAAILSNQPADGVFLATAPVSEPHHPAAKAALPALCDLVGTNRELDLPTRRKALVALAHYYLKGFNLDWRRVLGPRPARRIPLPGYPFACERHWIKAGPGGSGATLPVPRPPAGESRALPAPAGLQFFAPQWVRAELPGAARGPARTLLVLDQGDALTNEFRRAGHRVVHVVPGPAFAVPGPDLVILRAAEPADYRALCEHLRGQGIEPWGGIYAGPSAAASVVDARTTGPGRPIAGPWNHGFETVFLLVQAWGAAGFAAPWPLLCLHAGPATPGAEAIGGLARCLPHELPKVSCRLLHLAASGISVAELASRALTELDFLGPEEISIQGGQRYVRRFEAREASRLGQGSLPGKIAPGGTFLVSGGGGALGQFFATRLSRDFQANVVLLGRSPATAEKQAALAGGRAPGTELLYLQADVSDAAQVTAAVAECRRRFGSLRGVIHAAGVLEDGLLAGKDLASARRVLAPKVDGAIHLDAATRDEPLEFFALFSSIASVTGNLGQVDYAVANRFLDTFAGAREALRAPGQRRGKTIAFNWPYWAEGGMRPPAESVALVREVFGLRDLGREEGWQAFLLGLASDESQLVLLPAGTEGLWPLLNPAAPRREGGEPIPGGTVDGALVAQVETRLCAMLGELLQMEPSRIEVEVPVTDLGVDSMVFTQLILRLNRGLGLKLTPALLFAHPTLRSLATFLAREHASQLIPASPRETPAPAAPVRFPLSPGQQALWFLTQLAPTNFAYNLPIVLPLVAPVDGPALRRALETLAHRHGALRTIFRQDEGQPMQVVLPTADLAYRESSLASGGKEAARAALRTAHREPFAFDAGPPWRTQVFHRPGESSLLLISIHHLVFDGVSAGVFVEELLALYAAFRNGAVPQLARPARDYGEFVAWQRALLGGPEGERLASYWLGEMAGELPILDLPMARRRPAVQTYDGETFRFEIDAACADGLRELARREEATLYMVVLAAFYVLLHRYSGQKDLVIGSPMMGRNEPGFERGIGYFINMVALRADLGNDPTFREFLRAVRAKVFGALEHQDYPFPLLVQRLKLPRDPARSPLFQVEFNLESWARRAAVGATGQPAAEIAALEPFAWLHQEGEFDLALDVFDRDRPLQSAFRYNPALFDGAAIASMAEHFRNLLQAILADPAQRVSALPLLGANERQQILQTWNATQRPYPRERCVDELVAAQAGEGPGRIAVISGETQLTYAELDQRAARWAVALQGAGATSRSRIGICLDRSEAMLVAVLAVMKAGAAYVPLDPAFPLERLEFMAADAELRWVITQEKRRDWTAFRGSECLCVDDPACLLFASAPAVVQPPVRTPDDAVYILYTSGSTGRPKGVEITHRALVNFLVSMAVEPGLQRDDRLLAVTTLSFDIAALELYLPLVQGAQVVIARHEDASDGARLLRLLRASGSTVMQATPATWTMLLDAGWDSSTRLKVLCGGEALNRSLADRLLGRGREVWNLFGPTETTVWSTVARVEPGEEAVPIGRPIANTQVYILDAHFQPVPVGVAGELYLGGDGLARGYWRRPELTAEKFVPDPFGAGGARMYRTGDVARWRPGGIVDFLGRADSQVKIRGFRIELGEVETALLRHPGVAQAAVVARETRPGDRQLVAYWTARAPASPTTAELRAHLLQGLPEYMAPSLFVALERLPLTPNGKVDRQKLPAPGRVDLAPAPFVAPGNQVEQDLGALWADALSLERVGIHDNFFELGGHSLLASDLARRIRGKYPVELLDLFTYPTIHTLAGYLGSRGAASAPPPAMDAPTVAPVPVAGELPGPDHPSIAIVGMAGQFPGAADVATFWDNLKQGVESLARFTDEELAAAGIPAHVSAQPSYVKAGGVVAGAELFDADFFGYTPAHARLMEPQQRLLLETAWETLEDAGCDPGTLDRRIGVFAGIAANTYYQPDIRRLSETSSAAAASLAFASNEKDFAATRISYKLNLTGPSFAVQTACSSSLVAIHLACQAIANGECEAALAGGASVLFPQAGGYLHQKDMALSPDGHCRAFDAGAQGTVFTNGLALVLLKPLARAMADGDRVYAVIRGTAIGNDGSSKVDYMAPSVQGQKDVIVQALARAKVSASTIGMVEAHGTGTSVGDPIEVRALGEVFRQAGGAERPCALGSLKTNVGHLNTASGVASVIKAALCLHERVLVPSLHFQAPNPLIDFSAGPFYVSTQLAPWAEGKNPRRAGVSSLGIGGTNAHAILEEPPVATLKPSFRIWRLLPLSAKGGAALPTMARRLAERLAGNEVATLADVAFTLQSGRQELAWRQFVVSDGVDGVLQALAELPAPATLRPAVSEPRVGFLFAGGSVPVEAQALAAGEPAFRAALEQAGEILARRGFPPAGPGFFDASSGAKEPMAVAGLRVFLFEYALAQLWVAWGIRPDRVVAEGAGHAAAAVVAGVVTLEDALVALASATGHNSPNSPGGLPGNWSAVTAQEPNCPFLSTMHGDVTAKTISAPGFWSALPPGVVPSPASLTTGCAAILSLSPGSTWSEPQVERIDPFAVDPARDLSRDPAGVGRLLHGLGRLWQLGKKVRWAGLVAGETPRKVSLPSYPFNRKRYWLEPAAETLRPKEEPVVLKALPAPASPVPGRAAAGILRSQVGFDEAAMKADGPRFRKLLSADDFYFRDHVIAGKMILPGAVTLEFARAAGDALVPGRAVRGVREVVWSRPVTEQGSLAEFEVVVASREPNAGYELSPGSGDLARFHSRGKLIHGAAPSAGEILPVAEIRARCPQFAKGEEIYRDMETYGMGYGPSLRCVRSLHYTSREVLAELSVPDAGWDGEGAFEWHPSLMDGCFQTILVLVRDEAVANQTYYLPFALAEFSARQRLPRDCWVHSVASDEPGDTKATRTFQIRVADRQGRVVAHFRDYTIKFFPHAKLPAAMDGTASPAVSRALPASSANPGILPAVLPSASAASASLGAGGGRQLAPAVGALAAQEQILARLRQEVATLVGVEPGLIDPARDMGEYGLDSVLVIDFVSAINTAFGLALSPALFFEQKNLVDFAAYLATQNPALRPTAPAPSQSESTPDAASQPASPAPSAPLEAPLAAAGESAAPRTAIPGAPAPVVTELEPIVIVGMAGIFPQSPDLATFWQNLVGERDLITEIPPDRWSWQDYLGDPQKDGNKTNVKWGGFIPDVDKFDPRFFNLSPRDAEFMDPQQRIFLETVWKAIEDSGHAPASLGGSNTGLFVGVSSVDYQEIVMKNMGTVDVRMGAGLPIDMLPNRISFLLNLQGPSEPVSTACSSSLVALHRGVEAMRRGDCEQAIVGGVNLLLSPTPYIYFNKAGILSLDGRCKSFDHRANGYVRGEGAGAVFLKKLSRAIADGDRIYAVVKGTAVNHGGRTRTFGAPSPQAEALVISEAFKRAGVSPSSVNYIETHGTGTGLGDPVEVRGMQSAFEAMGAALGETPGIGSCGIGSVKTNVGHLEAAAGMASLVKVLLAMQNGRIPASLHFEKLNPFITLAQSPFYVVDRTRDWPRLPGPLNGSLRRRAGISSFGFGGVNSHVVLEEYSGGTTARAPAGASPSAKRPELLLLSARAWPQLQAAAQSLVAWIEANGLGQTDAENAEPGRDIRAKRPSLADVAYTLQVGRDGMSERLALVVSSFAEARAGLRGWLAGEAAGNLFQGKGAARTTKTGTGTPTTDPAHAPSLYRAGAWTDLALLWVGGETIDWEAVRRLDRCARISLPTYTFARERHWLDPQPGSIAAAAAEGSTAAREAVVSTRDPVDEILDQVQADQLSAEDAAALLEALAETEAGPVAGPARNSNP